MEWNLSPPKGTLDLNPTHSFWAPLEKMPLAHLLIAGIGRPFTWNGHHETVRVPILQGRRNKLTSDSSKTQVIQGFVKQHRCGMACGGCGQDWNIHLPSKRVIFSRIPQQSKVHGTTFIKIYLQQKNQAAPFFQHFNQKPLGVHREPRVSSRVSSCGRLRPRASCSTHSPAVGITDLEGDRGVNGWEIGVLGIAF